MKIWATFVQETRQKIINNPITALDQVLMELLQLCRDHAHKYYGDLLLAAEKSINDSFFEQAEKCTNNEEQRRYFEAMQQLGKRGGAMHTTFKQSLQQCFYNFSEGKDDEDSPNQQIDLENLSLVNRDELEDELAISVIISKSNSRNSEEMWKLNRRLAVLRGGKNTNDENNPFGPTMVCHALQNAVGELQVDNKVRILIYKQLGKIFVISFTKELKALNQILADKGILANLRFSVSQQQGTQSNQTAIGGGPISNPVESNVSIAHQQELFSAIRALQAAIGPRSQTAGGVSFGNLATDGNIGSRESFTPIDYALALSAIQQSSAFLNAATQGKALSAEKVEAKLIDQLSQKSDPGSRHKMTKQDADTVDVVGIIFRYMLDDPNLHDAVKSLLSHLHTPYLKLSLMDSSFLDNYQHSARLLLNIMADVGGKWVKDDYDRTVLPKIKTVVETVLKGFVDDASLFDRLLEDFSRFKENLEKRSRMVERRNTESQQGMEKLELAKQQASDEIEYRLTKSEINNTIAELLRQPWTDFLAFNLLRHGEESITWQSVLKVVDGAIWSVRPTAVANNKTGFQRHQADLEKSVSEGLATIGYEQEASKALLHALKEAQELAYHSAVMDQIEDHSSTKSTVPVTTTNKSAPATNKPDTNKIKTQNTKNKTARKTAAKSKPAPAPKPNEEEQRIINKLKDIAFGTWFEFDREKVIKRLKLAWFSRVTSHYMFVDQAGVKQVVENQYDLAKGICAGNIRIVELNKKSFMERALEAVFDKLKLNA